jgi:homoserine kinase type II
MAVYTEVPLETAATLIQELKLGELQSLQPCKGGIENTNYFVDTDQGRYVLTLFERLTHAQLPYYLYLMKHLAGREVPVPDPQANASGDILLTVMDKPACVVNRLAGGHELSPTPAHGATVGQMLARLHVRARDFARIQPNLRGLPWISQTAPTVMPHLEASQRDLLQSELAYQHHVAASSAYAALPRGPIHADLFRDNVMFADTGRAGDVQLTGFFDFYFAGHDAWLFDLAVCLNDWCIDLASGLADAEREQAFMQAYVQERAVLNVPFTAAERLLLPAMLRLGALRFWTSRLWDWHLPREASLLTPHDPTHFERVLRARVAHAGRTSLHAA